MLCSLLPEILGEKMSIILCLVLLEIVPNFENTANPGDILINITPTFI